MSARVPAVDAEAARAKMLELAPQGFEEVERGAELEVAAYLDAAGLDLLAAAFGDVSVDEVQPGWEDRWREFHRPVRAGGLWIGPPWEQQPESEPAVVVDPGRAFGTGAHPTTRACIELLVGLERGSVLDAGCGSGVLSVAAARLGFGPIHAVDIDPVAVEATMRTAAANDVVLAPSTADVLVGDLPKADVLVANIALPIVERLLARRPAPLAVTSGYLAGEAPSAPGWERADRIELDGWAADVLRLTA